MSINEHAGIDWRAAYRRLRTARLTLGRARSGRLLSVAVSAFCFRQILAHVAKFAGPFD